MGNNKEYASAGILPILKMNNGKKYIVLTKRTEDAKTNPGSHSGFFGWTDKNEINDPGLTAQREALEEILIFSSEKKEVYNLVFKKEVVFNNDETVKLIKLWNKKKKDLNLPEESIVSINPSIIKKVEFVECNGRTEVFILECDFTQLNLDDFYFFDGEKNEKLSDDDEKSLLDRQINFFEFNSFKDWWLNNKAGSLSADISFKTGEKVRNSFIDRENTNKISPTLVLALNKWWDKE